MSCFVFLLIDKGLFFVCSLIIFSDSFIWEKSINFILYLILGNHYLLLFFSVLQRRTYLWICVSVQYVCSRMLKLHIIYIWSQKIAFLIFSSSIIRCWVFNTFYTMLIILMNLCYTMILGNNPQYVQNKIVY